VIRATPRGVDLMVRVIPRANRSAVAGTRDDAILVRLHAPPVDGAANAELVRALAAALGVPARAVSIAAGERGRRKRVSVEGVDEATARARLVDGV
jgi:uncharacterized protein (TIGR00251 family)